MKIKITVEPEEIADIVAATTKSAKIKNILDKQLELLSKASKIAVDDKELVENLPAISHAISEICYLLSKD